MTDEEHQLLKDKAKKANLSMSAFVKKKCFEEGGLAELFKRQG